MMCGEVVQNCITGERSCLPKVLVPGLWSVCRSGLVVNGVCAAEGDVITARPNGVIDVRADDGSSLRGSWAAGMALDAVEEGAVLHVDVMLDGLERRMAPWRRWCEVSHITPESGDMEESSGGTLREFDDLVRRHLGYVRMACDDPYDHLTVEPVLRNVGRVKRPARGAEVYLAGHTEDWANRGIMGVRPRRLMAAERDRLLDVYENRVLARTVDLMYDVAGEWLHALQMRQGVLGDLQNRDVTGTYWVGRRLCKIWAANWDVDAEKERVDAGIRHLRSVRSRAALLRETEVWGAVPRRAQIGRSIRETNVLAKDERYRHVAVLWNALARRRHGAIADPVQEYRSRQSVAHAVRRYVMLIVLHALSQLRMVPEDEGVPIHRGASVVLANGWTLKWTADAVEMRSKSALTSGVRIVALPVNLAGGAEREVKDAIADICAGGTGAAQRVIVVYVSSVRSENEGVSQETRARLAGFRTTAGNPIGFIPVSPYDLRSVERVAAGIRWVIDGGRLAQYPFSVPTPPDAVRHIVSAQLEERSGRWILRRPPVDGAALVAGVRKEGEALARDVEKRSCAKREAEQRVEQCKRVRLQSGRFEARRARDECTRALAEGEGRVRTTAVFAAALEEAVAACEELARCPLCSAGVEKCMFTAQDGDQFVVECFECGAMWGIRTCSECGERFPILQPVSRPDVGSDEARTDSDWGQDVMAAAIRVDDVVAFRCPSCGKAC